MAAFSDYSVEFFTCRTPSGIQESTSLILSMQVKWACFIFFWIFGVEKQRSREAEKLGKSRSREAEKQRS